MWNAKPSLPRGRGATSNPANRFERILLERDVDWDPEQDPAPRTRFYRDVSQSIISYNDSPDIPFHASLNPYRGRNDHEIPAVLAAAKAAGAGWACTDIVRLPLTVAPLFQEWLEQHVPEKKEKILSRIRSIRGGRLNDPRFGSRMRGEGALADQIHQMFHVARRRAGLPEAGPDLSGADFRRPEDPQLALNLD